VVLAGGVFLFCALVSAFAEDLAWEAIDRGNLEVTAVLAEEDIYMAPRAGLFKSQDNGATYRNVLSLSGERVNFLAAAGKGPAGSLWAATSQGLFYSPDQGNSFRRVFKGKTDAESECLAVAPLEKVVYLGTRQGLFTSTDYGRSWHKAAGILGHSAIFSLASNRSHIYLASSAGVFRVQTGRDNWQRLLVAVRGEEDNYSAEEPEGKGESSTAFRVNYLALDPQDEASVFLATSQGVYASRDQGVSWQQLSSLGLLKPEVKFILVSATSQLYVLTKSGIFLYTQGRWQELSFGLEAFNINSLAVGKDNFLYAACKEGLFRAVPARSNLQQEITLAKEPAIAAVQQAAIEYAEVAPEKIKLWRRQVALKAALPQLSLGLNRDTTDLWHWESGSTTRTGDDVLIRGNDALEWQVSLSWDLSDLIFNEAQTSIDVRSRLMVELRGDIIDEVNKIYFERLRLKLELAALGLDEKKKRLEKELKLRELTATLDGLTDGYFSRQSDS
jgi:photosystem II stability/assembly factor-like uncharacterized protein